MIINLPKYMRRLRNGDRKLSHEHLGQIHHLRGSPIWQVSLPTFPSPLSLAQFWSSHIFTNPKLAFTCC